MDSFSKMDHRGNRFKGVTLLELMIVVAIISVLLSLGFISLKRLKANYDLTEATNKLYSDIEWIRQRSMGSAYPYGISFSNNSYTVFLDINDNRKYEAGTDTHLKTQSLHNITLSGYPNSYTCTRRGTPNQQFTITLKNNGNTKHISVSMFKTRIK